LKLPVKLTVIIKYGRVDSILHGLKLGSSEALGALNGSIIKEITEVVGYLSRA